MYATCIQGDAYEAVGILNETEIKKIQDGYSKLKKSFWHIPERIEFVDVTGMGYVLHDVMGDFIGMPKSTNPDNYVYYIDKDGNIPFDKTPTNEEDRLFDLVEGNLLVIDYYGHSELISVDDFIEKYLGV